MVECGGFSAAESALGIGRSAISQQMSDLEQRLGLRLCQRGRAGFSLTEEGREVYQSSPATAQRRWRAFRTEVNGLHQHLRGELNIGLTDNLVTLPAHAHHPCPGADSRSAGPDVRIQIRMIAALRGGDKACSTAACTSAWCRRSSALSGLEYQPLYSERSLLYCAVGHPLFYVDDQQLDDDRLNSQEAIAPTFRVPAEMQSHYQALNCTASASDREGMAFLDPHRALHRLLCRTITPSLWVQQGPLARAQAESALLRPQPGLGYAQRPPPRTWCWKASSKAWPPRAETRPCRSRLVDSCRVVVLWI